MSLIKSSLLFSLGTFFSRISGLIREVVLATVFGATALLDSFLIANRIPNMLRELAAEGALGSSFTKVFSELWEKDREQAKELLGNFIVFISLFLVFICFLGIGFSPYLVKFFFLFKEQAEDSSLLDHTVGLTRILFPFIAFMSFASILAGALHQKGRFFISALTPMALNGGYILGALCFSYVLKNWGPLWIESYFAPREVVGLALGVLLGGFCQMFLLYLAVKKNFFPKRSFFPKVLKLKKNKEIQKILKLMWPMIIAASAGQINVFVNTNFATSLAEGSVSYLSFAFRLLQLPIGIFAVSIGMVSLPTFTRNIAQDSSYGSLNRSLEKSIELTLWFLLPCVCFLMMNSYEVIQFLFERGRFTSTATLYTSHALFYYTLGLLSYGFVKVLTSLYFALEKIKFAMRVSLFSIFVNFILNSILVSHYKVNGLALSTSLVMTISASLLFWGVLREEKVRLNSKKIAFCLLTVALSFLCASFVQSALAQFCFEGSSKTQAFSSFYLFSFLFLQGIAVLVCFIVGFSFYSRTSLLSLVKKVLKIKGKG